jgi:hypothetical protein
LRKAGQQKPFAITQEEDTSLVPIIESDSNEDKVVTTEEELQGFLIIKSILWSSVDIQKVIARDTKSYFGILYDDNNRKKIANLYFNSKSIKRIGIFTEGKIETKFDISSLDDIYKHSDLLIAAAKQYQ